MKLRFALPLLVAALGLAAGCASYSSLPVLKFQPAPMYPFEMRRQGITGRVEVAFVVDKQGVPRNLHVVSSTHPEFDQAAIEAVSQWRFDPGTVNGRPVDTPMTIPISFDLPPDEQAPPQQ